MGRSHRFASAVLRLFISLFHVPSKMFLAPPYKQAEDSNGRINSPVMERDHKECGVELSSVPEHPEAMSKSRAMGRVPNATNFKTKLNENLKWSSKELLK